MWILSCNSMLSTRWIFWRWVFPGKKNVGLIFKTMMQGQTSGISLSLLNNQVLSEIEPEYLFSVCLTSWRSLVAMLLEISVPWCRPTTPLRTSPWCAVHFHATSLSCFCWRTDGRPGRGWSFGQAETEPRQKREQLGREGRGNLQSPNKQSPGNQDQSWCFNKYDGGTALLAHCPGLFLHEADESVRFFNL